jgi:hypothetical protein
LATRKIKSYLKYKKKLVFFSLSSEFVGSKRFTTSLVFASINFLKETSRVWVNQRPHFPLTPTYFPLLSASSAPIMTLAGYQQAGSGK